MDLSCIISSGDLELYVLGLLPQEEAYQVEQLSVLFPQIQQELDRISLSLERLADSAHAAPSPAVKQRFLQRIRTLKEEEIKAVPVPASETPVISMTSKRKNKSFLLAASISALLLSVLAIVYLSMENRQQHDRVAALQQEVVQLNSSIEEQQQQLQSTAEALALWQSPDVRKIALTQVPGKPGARAQLLWNQRTNEVYLTDVSLPAAPAGRQYQLWAIVEGKPVDGGVLSKAGDLAVQQMKTFAGADAFAITLEKEGGSSAPTLEQMYVMARAN